MRSGLVRSHEVTQYAKDTRDKRDSQLNGSRAQPGDSVVHRIDGKVVSREEWQEAQDKASVQYRRKRQNELDNEFDKTHSSEWKHGLDQKQQRSVMIENALNISSVKADEILRARRHRDDPLASFSEPVVTSSSSIKPRSIYEAPVNRFGIPAGYRWDGVVRGNNYEQRWFARLNERKHGRV